MKTFSELIKSHNPNSKIKNGENLKITDGSNSGFDSLLGDEGFEDSTVGVLRVPVV